MTRVRVDVNGAIGRLVLARPEKRNALDRLAAEELQAGIARLVSDAEVRVILLTATGEDFCAGADLEALAANLDADRNTHVEDARALGRVFVALREAPKPVVAAVRGRALAGGAGLATACDFVLAHEGARFGYPEVRVGFVPAMVMTMLRRIVGEKRAFDLVATGRTIGAREAESLGLVTRVLPEASFEADVTSFCANLAGTPAAALTATKRLFHALDGLDFATGIERGAQVNADARLTTDFRDGVRRFLQRPGETP